jgi:hypothetical protein
MNRKGIQRNIGEVLPPGTEEGQKLRALLHPRLVHGGAESRGKRKTKRPFVLQAPIHLTLSSDRARGTWALSHRKNSSKVTSMIYVYAARFKIRIHRAAVNGRQIHLLVKASDRKNLADFLRVLAGRVAILITGARKHQKRVGKFWRDLCWSKLINWGTEFFGVRKLISEIRAIKTREDLVQESFSPRFSKLKEGIP